METTATQPFASKLPNVGTTIFTVMSKMAQEHGAINLAQGFPDFDCSPRLVEHVISAMRNGHNQYAPMAGFQKLREEISQKLDRQYGHAYCPDNEVTVTSGASEAIFDTVAAFVRPGDEVIVFEPAYDLYVPAIELVGGVPIYVRMEYPDYSIDWGQVRDRITDRTRMVIINSPHNPTGSVLGSEDMETLSELLADTDIILLSDEVYQHIIFDGKEHESAVRYEALVPRTVAVFSFGKTYHATGWKVGYCVAPEHLMKEIRKVHQYNTFSTNTPMQCGISHFMEDHGYFEQLGGFYQKKRDQFIEAFAETGLKMVPCSGTYFQLLNFGDISEMGDVEYAEHLTREKGVAFIPVSVFYHDRYDAKVLRACFAKEPETFQQAAEKLCSR